ncbi:hypothetical protein MINS_03010 [Mycolicibacterium insubricum]|nr:hypothetical protein MINS_03010 [Mycolicibacterium insubricum]
MSRTGTHSGEVLSRNHGSWDTPMINSTMIVVDPANNQRRFAPLKKSTMSHDSRGRPLPPTAAFELHAPTGVECPMCSVCSSSGAATGSDPDWPPVAGLRDVPV